MKYNLKYHGILWHLLLIGVLSFIFGNSLITPELSYSSSAAITELLKPSQGAKAELLEGILRKAAHLVEFAALGVVSVVLKNFYKKTGKPFSIWLPMFFVLLVGVVDEWLQVFSDRSSSVLDVLLDFCGALMGMAVAVVFLKLLHRYKNRRKLL